MLCISYSVVLLHFVFVFVNIPLRPRLHEHVFIENDVVFNENAMIVFYGPTAFVITKLAEYVTLCFFCLIP